MQPLTELLKHLSYIIIIALNLSKTSQIKFCTKIEFYKWHDFPFYMKWNTQLNTLRGWIYLSYQTQHDNYLSYGVYYMPEFTKLCNYPFNICDKGCCRLKTDIYDPEKTSSIYRHKSQTQNISFRNHKTQPDIINQSLLGMLVSVVLNNTWN